MDSEKEAPQGDASTNDLKLPPAPSIPPLCIDLDDTLIRTDLLVEQIIAYTRDHPAQTVRLLLWFRAGKAAGKTELARHSVPTVELLPYRASILDLIIQHRKSGTRIILATASPFAWAQQVADHLGLFDEVIATTEKINLKGAHKQTILVERFGVKGYDYVGDSAADLPVWESCLAGYAIAGQPSLTSRLPSHVALVPNSDRSRASLIQRWLRALRVHQWSKNLLVLTPLIMAHRWSDITAVVQSIGAAVSFSLAASSVYIINDLFDLNSDRAHRSKCHRPFASGEIAIASGLQAALLCLLGSLAIAPIALFTFFPILFLYLVTTTLYSVSLKRIPIVDIFTLASLYTLRIFAGAAATGISVSPWLLAFSLFFFLGLASVKRFVEFGFTSVSSNSPSETSRRGYTPADASWIAQLGMGTGIVSVLVLALYIQAPDVTRLYRSPATLWFLTPLVLFWTVRVWFLAHRQQLHDDPVVFALRDCTSLFIGAIAAAVLLCAM